MRPHHDEQPMGLADKTAIANLCIQLNELLKNRQAHPGHMDTSRDIVGYEPRGYDFHPSHTMGNDATVTSWGIWPRWGYADRKDLPSHFGGPYVPIGDARRYLQQAS